MCLQLFWRTGLSKKKTVKPSWTCPSHQCSTADHAGFWGLTRIQGWWDVCRSIAELSVGTLTSPCRAQPPVKALHVAWKSALKNRIKYRVCVCTLSATQNLWINSIGLKCLTLNSPVSDQPLARNPTDIERLITVKGIVIRCSDLTPAAWTKKQQVFREGKSHQYCWFTLLSPHGWDIPEQMEVFFAGNIIELGDFPANHVWLPNVISHAMWPGWYIWAIAFWMEKDGLDLVC